ncbi:hypothetical protein ACVWY2_002121 [Bradyrhizobium sp. JR6.1]
MRSAIMPPTGRESRTERDDQRDQHAGRHARDVILHGEIEWQRVGEADEAAEGDEVEEHEPAAVGILQQRAVGLQRDLLALARRVLGRERVIGEHHQHRNQEAAEHGLPAPMFGNARCKQRVEHDAHIAGTGDPHDHALILRRIPAAGLGQGDRERGAADAERKPEQLDRELAGQPEMPDRCGRNDHDELGDDAGALGADDVGENAHRHAQQRPGENGNGDQGELLVHGQVHVARDVDDQRSERDPRHETDVEIQERGEQGRPVTCLLELG